MIIGLCGQAGSGKDTVADILVAEHGYIKIALADPLKRICRDVFWFSDEQLWGPSEKRNEPDKRYVRAKCPMHETLGMVTISNCHCEYLTPRLALQRLGTEWGRMCYPNVWIDYALRMAVKTLSPEYHRDGVTYDARSLVTSAPPGFRCNGVVISDVRFRNEVDAISQMVGGRVWRIERPGAGLQGEAAKHQSEQEQKEIPQARYDRTLHNDQSLEYLKKLVALHLSDAMVL
jgi:hypothetical protein